MQYLRRLIWIVFFTAFLATGCRNSDNGQVADINRAIRDSLMVLTESGVLESIDAQAVSTPRRWNVEYRIISLIPEGSFVKPGDTLVVFDPNPILDKLQEATAKLNLSLQKLKQTREENALNLDEKIQAIDQLKMQYEIDSTRLANARFESETMRQDLALELEKSKLQIQRAFKNLSAQKIINQTKERLILVEIQQAQINLQRIQTMLKEMQLIATQSGVVIYRHYRRKSRTVREGETVYPGQMILKIANLNRMKALLQINEVDRQLVKTGQQARVVIDAYPDTTFRGRVESISKIAGFISDGGTVKAYGLDIFLDGAENFRLKPGLSVRAEIIVDTLRHAYRVPIWCLKQGENGFFVKNGKGEALPVKVLRFNDGFAFVRGALKDGMPLGVN
ncbi:MAG: HlyD family efflux transporter periplasmic adaptor subunit [Calditrichaeota bacterium]|nr:HlyD family efflux transporter periplasmic adaptor subunit [Calditrichota bacterium]